MIRTFQELTAQDVELAGGKGANLGEMTRAGLSVPEGFVLTSDAYRRFIRENNLEGEMEEQLREAGEDEKRLLSFAEGVREKIRKGHIPEDLEAQIRAAYDKLGRSVRVAVRSSATAEDLPDASFAGQQETYLNVVGIEDVLEQIRNCYASLWGNRAVIYRKNQGYDQKTVALAVVIQKMVESEKAGVLFTVNPLNADPREMQINASYGLGESVVSGSVTADTYITDKEGNILQKIIGSKETRTCYDEGGKGTRKIPVSEEDQKAQALIDEEIRALAREGAKVETYYHMPMDIEWGIEKGRIYLLQARAITTLKEKDPEEEKQIRAYLKDSKSTGALKENLAFLLEKMPFTYYPVDYDLMKRINDAKSIIFAEGGILMDMQPRIDKDAVMVLPPNEKRLSRKILHLPAILKEIGDMRGCEKKLREQMPRFRRELEQFMALDYERLSLSECGKIYLDMEDYLSRMTYCRFKYALFSSAVNKGKLERALKKVDPKHTVFDLYWNLDNETAVMARDVKKVADLCSRHAAWRDLIRSGATYEQLIKEQPDAKEAMAFFFEKHGYKTDYNCYCVIARSFLEDPDRLIHLIRPLLEQPEEEKADFNRLMENLRQSVGDRQYRILREKIDIFRYMHVVREESQMMWETLFFYTKKLLARMGELAFGERDYLQNVAYLFTDEINALCKKGVADEIIRETIARRIRKRPLAEKVWERAKLLVFEDTGDVLKGVCGSAGEAIGKVCVIKGPEEFYKFQKGDVLVCNLTDPEWTPLFSLASAVVADTGAALSHAAIVAREYGIPAVLGVGLATVKYKDGDRIRVDGTKGTVSKVGCV
ncbi:MAG: phosphoenolpyruvate synthase [Lachnospiraceae bacterium]|nr:phosphoenolpyruvate synthase [Lachnospiraceae bacterium]